MNKDTTATVQKLITELDAAISKDGARVRLSQCGGGADESRIIATQQGYLRLGIEFLRAAFVSPRAEAPTQITIDLDYLITDNSDIDFGWFERVETLPEPAPSTPNRSRFSPAFFIIAVVICLGILVLIGFATVVQWTFHFFTRL